MRGTGTHHAFAELKDPSDRSLEKGRDLQEVIRRHFATLEAMARISQPEAKNVARMDLSGLDISLYPAYPIRFEQYEQITAGSSPPELIGAGEIDTPFRVEGVEVLFPNLVDGQEGVMAVGKSLDIPLPEKRGMSRFMLYKFSPFEHEIAIANAPRNVGAIARGAGEIAVTAFSRSR
ncbi:MAG: hypothetical protein JWO96_178 [Candidatus Saccharibacteria bacterium]|nr:hypothetical protein [Candidatus Saccharibacteria bacterium]